MSAMIGYRNARNERGAASSGIVFFLSMIVIASAIGFYAFGFVVPPGKVGIRQITFGPGQGFSKTGLRPGYHWSIPLHSTIHMVPQTAQLLHFHREKTVVPDSFGSLDIQTTDGATVDVDITVIYRFFQAAATGENAHGGPADLITSIGISPERWKNHVAKVADDQVRRGLGKLATGQFYDPSAREQQIVVAQAEMNRILAEDGIAIDSVLLRRYTYAAERIDRAIFEKNLQDQEERLNSASSVLADAKATLERVSAEWDAKIKTLQVEGENKARIIQSEAELYDKQKIAEGDLLVAKAKADIDRLRAAALSQEGGSAVYVARELAPLLGSLKGGVVSDLDPYDLEAWIKRFGLKDGDR